MSVHRVFQIFLRIAALLTISFLFMYILQPSSTSISQPLRGRNQFSQPLRGPNQFSQPLRGPNQSSIPLQETPEILKLLPMQYLSHYKNPCWVHRDIFRCIPKVYLSGMPKCGSTDLFTKLIWHSSLTFPSYSGNPIKENHYWARMRLGKSTNHLIQQKLHPTSFEYYLGLMKEASEQIEVNEGTISIDGTQSLLWDMTGWEERYPEFDEPPFSNADLIHDITPDAKIIVTLRNPTNRLYSDYLYFGEERNAESFHQVIQEELVKFKLCLHGNSLRKCCYDEQNDPQIRLNLGVYICYVKDWYELFGNNMIIVTLEEYSKNAVMVLLRLFRFLDIGEPRLTELQEFVAKSKTENSRSNQYKAVGEMSQMSRDLLNEFYRPYNEQLARLLDDTRFLFMD